MARSARQPDGVPRKRGWGEGSIRWKNGAWEITVRPYRGAPQDPWTRLPGVTLAEAEARLDVMVAQVNAGTHEPRPRSAPPMKVAELSARYEQHLQTLLKADSLEQARVDDVAGIMRCHVVPAFGDDPVTSIDSAVLYDYMAGKRQGLLPVIGNAHTKLAARTIRHHITAIGQMFRWAAHHERKLAAYDPTAGLRLPTLDEEETEPYELDHVEAIRRQLDAGTPRRVGVVLLATGARLNEVLGALEHSWHERDSSLEIRYALKREGGKLVLRPRAKNRAAKRNLATGDALAEVFDEQLAHNATLAVRPTQLFATDVGTAWNPSNFRNRHWYPAVYVGYAKVMPASERERWLACVPAELRDAAELLCLEEITVNAVLELRWDALCDGMLTYRDADGAPRTTTLPAALNTRLITAREQARARAEHADKEFHPGATRVFPGRRWQRIGLPAFLKAVFRDPFEAIGLNFDRRIHRARHTYVSLVSLEPDITEREIQRRTGHACASSIERYRHVFKHHDQQVADVLHRLDAGLPDRQ